MAVRESLAERGALGSTTITAPLYAYGVVRVSEEGGRSGRKTTRTTNRVPHVRSGSRRQQKVDTFRSPDEQRQRINGATSYLEIGGRPVELAQIFEEIDVSGRRPLARRKGLLAAVEGIEAGYAKVLIVAYFDRLMRDLDVKREVVRRIEAVGGLVFAVDFGAVTHATAMQRMTSDMLAVYAEFVSNSLKERLNGVQKAAIAEGLPIGTIAPGYRQDPTTYRLVRFEPEATVMKEAFEMRANGAGWEQVRRHMRAGGIPRSTKSVRNLLRSRTYLGELFHGEHRSVNDHAAIVDEALFERVQRQKGRSFNVPGRKSPLLLAGMRLLKCGSCGRSMGAGATVVNGKTYPLYKCNLKLEGCARKLTIDAKTTDDYVASYVQERLQQIRETQGVGWELIQARREAEEACEERDTVVHNLARVKGAAAAQEIADAQAKADAAEDRVAELEHRARVLGDTETAAAGKDWDGPDTTLEDRREMVAAVLARVVVTSGRDAEGRGVRGAARLQLVDIDER